MAEYKIVVDRISVKSKEFAITADSEDEAVQFAEDIAKNTDYRLVSESSCEYDSHVLVTEVILPKEN